MLMLACKNDNLPFFTALDFIDEITYCAYEITYCARTITCHSLHVKIVETNIIDEIQEVYNPNEVGERNKTEFGPHETFLYDR